MKRRILPALGSNTEAHSYGSHHWMLAHALLGNPLLVIRRWAQSRLQQAERDDAWPLECTVTSVPTSVGMPAWSGLQPVAAHEVHDPTSGHPATSMISLVMLRTSWPLSPSLGYPSGRRR